MCSEVSGVEVSKHAALESRKSISISNYLFQAVRSLVPIAVTISVGVSGWTIFSFMYFFAAAAAFVFFETLFRAGSLIDVTRKNVKSDRLKHMQTKTKMWYAFHRRRLVGPESCHRHETRSLACFAGSTIR